MISKLLQKEFINVQVTATDWQDAIRKSAQVLVDKHKVKARYVDAIIESVKENGPYIVITPHVAIPHARSECGVLETSMSLTTLVSPIEFGNKENDPVKYLICLAAKDNQSHIEALSQLAKLLEMPEFYELLDRANNSEEIYEFLVKEEGR